PGLDRLHPEIAEGDGTPAGCDAAVVALLHLSKLRSLGGKHESNSGDRTALAPREDLAFEDPALDPDDAVLGLGLGEAQLDVGAERVERDAPLAVRLDAAHLAPAEAAGAADPDPLRAELHRRRDGLLHRAAERDAA